MDGTFFARRTCRRKIDKTCFIEAIGSSTCWWRGSMAWFCHTGQCPIEETRSQPTPISWIVQRDTIQQPSSWWRISHRQEGRRMHECFLIENQHLPNKWSDVASRRFDQISSMQMIEKIKCQTEIAKGEERVDFVNFGRSLFLSNQLLRKLLRLGTAHEPPNVPVGNPCVAPIS